MSSPEHTPVRTAEADPDAAAGPAPEAGFDLHSYVPTLVVNLANQLWRVGAAFYRENYGVGMVEVRLLLHLDRHAGQTASDIARTAELDKAAVSRGLAALESGGLVRLEKDLRGGGRRRVTLSGKGRRLCHSIAAASLERQAWILGELTPEEVAHLSELLRRLHGRVAHLNDNRNFGAARLNAAPRDGEVLD
ncbi:MarR family winged helix-turn-helix transcriptional regulator [Roseomonas sp. BN140053]|uniref:MarR family winged helix-turn-helix transcriptional regulator n=1 Tax=Roseomonas sp. BN140053 TaxID=3391898 RepID=UPI0039E7B726